MDFVRSAEGRAAMLDQIDTAADQANTGTRYGPLTRVPPARVEPTGSGLPRTAIDRGSYRPALRPVGSSQPAHSSDRTTRSNRGACARLINEPA
jgi:hypothetical protein